MPTLPTGRSRLTWLWGLILALSAIKASSSLWLPTRSPLQHPLCGLMPGLSSCLDGH